MIPGHSIPDLRVLRVLIGASVREVARRSGTTAATVSRIETGDRGASAETREAIAQAMADLTAEHLRGDDLTTNDRTATA